MTRTQRVKLETQKHLRRDTMIQTVASALEHAMTKRGLTKSSFARMLGRPESYVNDILKGRNLTLRTVADLMGAMGCERVRVEFE